MSRAIEAPGLPSTSPACRSSSEGEHGQASLPTLLGARVVELHGDDSVAYAGRLLAAAGATVVVVELEGTEPMDAARRSFLHEGKLSVLLDGGTAGTSAVVQRLAACATAVLGTEALAGAPSRDCDDPWQTALRGASLAVSAAARILGMGAEPLADLAAALSGGTLFPIPGSGAPSAANASGESPRLLRARDGWVVSGPSALGDETLSRLVNIEADSLESWIGARTRDEACTTLQLWRTGYAPVYDLTEAAGVDLGGTIPARAPLRGEHTRPVLQAWLGLDDDAFDGNALSGVVAAT